MHPNTSWQWQVENEEQHLAWTGQLCGATTTAREVQTGQGEKFLHQKEYATLEQMTQGGCGITILGGFQHSDKQSHS